MRKGIKINMNYSDVSFFEEINVNWKRIPTQKKEDFIEVTVTCCAYLPIENGIIPQKGENVIYKNGLFRVENIKEKDIDRTPNNTIDIDADSAILPKALIFTLIGIVSDKDPNGLFLNAPQEEEEDIKIEEVNINPIECLEV